MIAVMTSRWRAMMKHSGQTIREWDAKEAHLWDSAVAGSSSLRAAILRALQCENGAARGSQVGHHLWDMKQFYDSIQLPKLVNELVRRGFPAYLFVLGFMAHAAPIFLRVAKSMGPTIFNCKNPIVARCQL